MLLATGGCGKVYLYTTNPDIATGDGVAMAYRAGAAVANMEFIQFHPTCLYSPKGQIIFDQRGGARRRRHIEDIDGVPFMDRYHPLKSLAPRDIVARAIDNEMKKSGAPYVSTGHHASSRQGSSWSVFRISIPRACNSESTSPGTDPGRARRALPVRRRGDHVDGRTEIAGTLRGGRGGLHGIAWCEPAGEQFAAGGARCARIAPRCGFARRRSRSRNVTIPAWQSGHAQNVDELVVINHNWDEIRRMMWDYVGIVRTNKRLQRARSRIANLQEEIQQYYWDFIVTSDLLELRNIATVAELIITSALQRPESRGLNYNLDYPAADPAWAQRDTILRKPQ